MAQTWYATLGVLLVFVSLVTLGATRHGPRVKRIVGGRQAKPPPIDDPVVFARLYERDARVEGFRNGRSGVYSFLGIHYAEPPIGRLRYARPVYKRLQGDLNATVHGQPCIQPDPYRPNRVVGSEDCLLLNVYTPRMPDETTGLPVLFWIHPGGYRHGSAAQYDATPIAQEGAIVVAPQYRLGSLGIIGDGTKEFDGNLAMFDMTAALRWVSEYIQYFGGDPKRITPIGHGSGASSAMYLSMSKARSRSSDVSGVVAMSGTALSQYATDKEPVQSVQEIAAINGCPTTDELTIVSCLRKKSAEEIIQNDSKVQTERLAGRLMVKSLTGSVGFQPHIGGEDDGRSLPSIIVGEPEQQLRSGGFGPVPLLTGVAKHETANAFTIGSINEIYGSAEKFLQSLTGSLKELSGLLRLDKVTGEIAKPILPGLTGALTPTLNDLLKVPDSLNVNQIIAKVTESTTDILFNLPAVLTSQVWSQLAPAFMYSFEHNGTVSKGINFLRGLPIVANALNSSEYVGHGDELGYMFDANDIYGQPLEGARLQSSDDLKVRKNLIGMLVKFAEGTPKDGQPKKDGSLFDGLFQSVTGKGTPFIRVDTELEAASDFRFCELSVLGAALTPLTATTCKGLADLLTPLTNVLGGVGGVLTGAAGGGGVLTGAAGGGGVLTGAAGGGGVLSGGNRGGGGLLGGGGSGGLVGGGGQGARRPLGGGLLGIL